MRTSVVIALCLLACACSSNSGGTSQNTAAPTESPAQPPAIVSPAPVMLRESITTFKDAQAACAGALGSVTFSMGHARAHGTAGVDLKESPTATNGIVTMVFTDKSKGKSSTVEVNGHDRSVGGINVIVRKNRSVACIMAQ